MFRTSLALLALLVITPLATTAEAGKLLATASLAGKVKQVSLSAGEAPTVRRSKALRLQNEISEFVIAQVQSMRDISQEQLRAQLQAILCVDSNTTSTCDCSQPPYVFSNDWGGQRGTSQFVVAYVLYLGFMGPQGSISVLENYVRDNRTGTVRRTAIGSSEFDGYVVNFQMVQQFYGAPEIWVLAWGEVLGASGRGIRGRASVYRVKADAIEALWDDAMRDNVSAQKNALGWEVTYADHELLYGNKPEPYFFDVYAVERVNRTFTRVVHYQHAPY